MSIHQFVDGGAPPIVPPTSNIFMWGTRGDPGAAADTAALLHPSEWLRNRSDWDNMDPGLDGVGPFTWGNLDSKVAACRNAGVKLLLCLGGTYPNGAAQIANYASFCAALAARYNFPEFGGIEFGNEPSSSISGQRIADVAVAACDAIAAVQANKPANLRFKTFAGAFGEVRAYLPSTHVAEFFDGILGRSQNIDYVSWHPYHRPNPPEITDGVNGRPGIQVQRDMLLAGAAAHGYTGRFAVTEFGWPTMPLPRPSPVVRGTTTEYRQAYGCVREALILLASNRYDVIVQFQLLGSNTPTIEEGGLGMVRCPTDVDDNGNTPGGGTRKPLFYAWRTLGNILDDGVPTMEIIAEPTPPSMTPWHYIYRKSGGRFGHVFWVYPEYQTGSITLTGLGSTVRKTLLDGTQSIVPTTNGSLTLDAVNNPTFVDVVW